MPKIANQKLPDRSVGLQTLQHGRLPPFSGRAPSVAFDVSWGNEWRLESSPTKTPLEASETQKKLELIGAQAVGHFDLFSFFFFSVPRCNDMKVPTLGSRQSMGISSEGSFIRSGHSELEKRRRERHGDVGLQTPRQKLGCDIGGAKEL